MGLLGWFKKKEQRDMESTVLSENADTALISQVQPENSKEDIVGIVLHPDGGGQDQPNMADDYGAFCLYRSVFDHADNFSVVSKENIAGGTDQNGITKIVYGTNNGKRLYLEVDGGFPVPELARMDFYTQDRSKEMIDAIIVAFGKYFKGKISRHDCVATVNGHHVLHLYGAMQMPGKTDAPVLEKKQEKPQQKTNEDMWDRAREIYRIRALPIQEQLRLLEEKSHEYDTIIGEIYINNPPPITQNGGIEDKRILQKLLGNAVLVKEGGYSGQGDYGINRMFSLGNLLIGVTCMAFWRGSPFIVNECKVYRIAKNKTVKDVDIDKIYYRLF